MINVILTASAAAFAAWARAFGSLEPFGRFWTSLIAPLTGTGTNCIKPVGDRDASSLGRQHRHAAGSASSGAGPGENSSGHCQPGESGAGGSGRKLAASPRYGAGR